MASGTLNINLQSVDYTNGVVACYSAAQAGAFNRGYRSLDTLVNWNVDDSGTLTISHGGSTGDLSWFVCASRFTLDVQWSPDGASWQTIGSSYTTAYNDCGDVSRRILTRQLAQLLISEVGNMTIPNSGYIRVITYADSACPTATFPNAYPNDAASQAVAVPIYIEVDYKPGATLDNGVWLSHNRTGGKCHILTGGGNWKEMKTIDGKGKPPAIYHDNAYFNQKKLGRES